MQSASSTEPAGGRGGGPSVFGVGVPTAAAATSHHDSSVLSHSDMEYAFRHTAHPMQQPHKHTVDGWRARRHMSPEAEKRMNHGFNPQLFGTEYGVQCSGPGGQPTYTPVKRLHRAVRKHKRGAGPPSTSWLMRVAECVCTPFARRDRAWAGLFLILLSLLAALVAIAMDIAVSRLRDGHVDLFKSTKHVSLQLVYWIGFMEVVVLVCVILVRRFAPNAIGSGVPQVELLLSGVHIRHFLSLRTLLAKVFALTLTLGSGVFAGKKGPYVHIACAMASNMLKWPLFRTMAQLVRFRHLVLVAACSAGVAATFGAPVGGILFSIEVTSTYYPVRDYWYAFIAAIPGSVVFRLIWHRFFDGTASLSPIMNNVDLSTELAFYTQELVLFMLMGVVAGLGAALFVTVLNALGQWQKRCSVAYPTLFHPITWTIVVIGITGTLTFPTLFGDHNSRSSLLTLRDLFEEKDTLAWSTRGASLLTTLFIFLSVRIVGTLVTLTLPIPRGAFVPVMVIGAAFGRLVAELLIRYGDWGIDELNPASFSIVGAAAFAAGCTHAISTAVVVFEWSGDLSHSIEILLASAIAISVAHHLQHSMFRSVVFSMGLPFVPDIQFAEYHLVASDLMDPIVDVIPIDASIENVCAILLGTRHACYPLVYSLRHPRMLGRILRPVLCGCLLAHCGGVPVHHLPLLVQEALARAREERGMESCPLALSAYLAGLKVHWAALDGISSIDFRAMLDDAHPSSDGDEGEDDDEDASTPSVASSEDIRNGTAEHMLPAAVERRGSSEDGATQHGPQERTQDGHSEDGARTITPMVSAGVEVYVSEGVAEVTQSVDDEHMPDWKIDLVEQLRVFNGNGDDGDGSRTQGAAALAMRELNARWRMPLGALPELHVQGVTPLIDVHTLFVTHQLDVLYVLGVDSQVEGVITRVALSKFLWEHEDTLS